jgi:hypothetical protein
MELMLRMSKGLEHYFDSASGIMIVSCSEKTWYQDFSIWIDDYEFEVLVEDYFLSMNDLLGDSATAADDDICIIGIIDDYNATYWTLGDSFLRGYYTILDNNDHANAKMGFAPHAASDKAFVSTSRLPVESMNNILWELTWIAQLFLPSSGAAIISWLVGTVWVFFFGIYESDNWEVTVTIE